MNEHTPTTDEVRHMFATAPLGGAQPVRPVPALMREFDRWLAEERAEAWDDGYLAHRQEMNRLSVLGMTTRIPNPYRKETP